MAIQLSPAAPASAVTQRPLVDPTSDPEITLLVPEEGRRRAGGLHRRARPQRGDHDQEFVRWCRQGL